MTEAVINKRKIEIYVDGCTVMGKYAAICRMDSFHEYEFVRSVKPKMDIVAYGLIKVLEELQLKWRKNASKNNKDIPYLELPLKDLFEINIYVNKPGIINFLLTDDKSSMTRFFREVMKDFTINLKSKFDDEFNFESGRLRYLLNNGQFKSHTLVRQYFKHSHEFVPNSLKNLNVDNMLTIKAGKYGGYSVVKGQVKSILHKAKVEPLRLWGETNPATTIGILFASEEDKTQFIVTWASKHNILADM